MDGHERRYVECLDLIHRFETAWAYYTLTDGRLGATECRDWAKLLADCLRALAEKDGRIAQSSVFDLPEPIGLDQVLERLETWVGGEGKWPYATVRESHHKLGQIFTHLKGIFIEDLHLTTPPLYFHYDTSEYRHSFIRWHAHLPDNLLPAIPDDWLEQASATPTVAVIGDIRNSQGLMTSAKAEVFSKRMVEFLERTRGFIWDHGGIFDKFTGDGFVAYFNQTVCQAADADYLECFSTFVRDETAFASVLFDKWASDVEVPPHQECGLAMGADNGIVAFADLQNHFVAVGEAVVSAARMVDGAQAGETLVNEALRQELQGHPGVVLTEQRTRPKAAQILSAWSMTVKQ